MYSVISFALWEETRRTEEIKMMQIAKLVPRKPSTPELKRHLLNTNHLRKDIHSTIIKPSVVIYKCALCFIFFRTEKEAFFAV